MTSILYNSLFAPKITTAIQGVPTAQPFPVAPCRHPTGPPCVASLRLWACWSRGISKRSSSRSVSQRRTSISWCWNLAPWRTGSRGGPTCQDTESSCKGIGARFFGTCVYVYIYIYLCIYVQLYVYNVDLCSLGSPMTCYVGVPLMVSGDSGEHGFKMVQNTPQTTWFFACSCGSALE